MNLTSGRITIDLEHGTVGYEGEGPEVTYPLSDPRAFEIVSGAWLRCGWDTKYVYTFSWFGRPIIQLPDDLVRMQEVVYRVKPDAIVETGIAHGGSLVFYASLLRAMGGGGRVIGVDVEIRAHNRSAIERHEFIESIELIEGSSIDPEIVDRVRRSVGSARRVLVVLDSNHTRDHVRAELEAYAPLVSVDSYVVACDGLMKDVAGAPRSKPEWREDNPYAAIGEFVKDHPEFVCEQPPWPFDESEGLRRNVTYWPSAWLRRVR